MCKRTSEETKELPKTSGPYSTDRSPHTGKREIIASLCLGKAEVVGR
jgi:hypothetical protein